MPSQLQTRRVEEHLAELDGQPQFWRAAPYDGLPTLYVHGVPTSSMLWPAFLERAGGYAPDLPGFGRSGKRGDLDYTPAGLASALGRFAEHVGLERFNLVVHDWGAIGLILAQRMPERIARLVVFNSVPLLPGYRWHRVARIWRRRLLGEIAMGATTRLSLRMGSRPATTRPEGLPRDFLDGIWRDFDQGTQRAILKLYRSADPQVLEAAGANLTSISSQTLILWGAEDPYIPARFAGAYGERLGADVRMVKGAGHWPWLDRPELVDEASDFLAGGA